MYMLDLPEMFLLLLNARPTCTTRACVVTYPYTYNLLWQMFNFESTNRKEYIQRHVCYHT